MVVAGGFVCYSQRWGFIDHRHAPAPLLLGRFMTDQVQLLRQVRLALQNDDFESAIDALQQAAALARESGDSAGEGRHLGNLALIYYRVQRPDKALHYFEHALASARADGDRLTEDGILGN